MRFRRYLWLFVLALSASCPAVADSIPATITHTDPTYNYAGFSTLQAYCEARAAADGQEVVFVRPYPDYGTCDVRALSGPFAGSVSQDMYRTDSNPTCPGGAVLKNYVCESVSCPSGYTLNGMTCDKSTTPPPPNPCESKNGQNGTQTYAYSFTRPEENAGNGDVICVDSCAADVVLAGEGGYSCAFSSVGAGQCVGSHTVQYIFNGQSCSGNTQKTGDTTNGKKPPCAAHEGVLTTDDGRVMCLPEGTPKTRKPDVQQKKKTETYPDGSQKETVETRTKDPGTGAEHVNSSSSSTGGQAGPEGEQISDEDISPGTDDGTCTGDDCGEGGGAEFNGPEGDLYEKGDRTIKQAIDDFVSRVKSSGVFAAASNWFTVAGMAGSCGGMSANIPMINETISMDEYICGQSAHVALQIAGIVVLALAAFAGWKIAFL